jgi:hypothetical protein
VYGWIWRHLPFGVAGKLTGSLLLISGAAALLWFVVFPWLDPFVEQTLLPWDDGQLTGDFAPSGGEVREPVGPGGEVLDDAHDIPYETDQ